MAERVGLCIVHCSRQPQVLDPLNAILFLCFSLMSVPESPTGYELYIILLYVFGLCMED